MINISIATKSSGFPCINVVVVFNSFIAVKGNKLKNTINPTNKRETIT